MKINENDKNLSEKDLLIKELLTKLHKKDEDILNLEKKLLSKEKEIKKVKIENEKNLALIYELQRELNEVLKEKQFINEKRKIERTKPFISKTEKIDKVVINEV